MGSAGGEGAACSTAGLMSPRGGAPACTASSRGRLPPQREASAAAPASPSYHSSGTSLIVDGIATSASAGMAVADASYAASALA